MQSSLASASKKEFNFDIEALRGVAAMLVVWGHAFYTPSQVDPFYLPGGIWTYTPPAHLSVIVFFFLSGYVIGLTQKADLTAKSSAGYLKKRFVRLYPIFLVCFLLALLLANRTYSITSIASHLSMTMGLTAPIIIEISPAWSLTYEVLFYLLFIPVSILKVNRPGLILSFLVLGILSAHFYSEWAFISSFFFGATFWISGLYLANNTRCYEEKNKNYAKMASLLLLLLVSEILDAPATLFSNLSKMLFRTDLSAVVTHQPIVAYRDLAYLPFCIVLIGAFAKVGFKYKKVLEFLIIVAPLVTYYHYQQNWNDDVANLLVLPTIMYGLALLLYFFQRRLENIAKLFINSLIWSGSVSYGLYIFHYPILTYLHRTSVFSGTLSTFLMRLVLLISISFAGAYLLEKVLQPRVKQWFMTK